MMQTKLTLKLEANVIRSAKRYARSNRRSLSKLVERYFRHLAHNKERPPLRLTPIVSSLSGILKHTKDQDSKSDYSNYLTKKYSS